MLSRLDPFIRPALREIAGGTALLLLAAALELLQPWPVKWLIDYVLTPHAPPAWLVHVWPEFGAKSAGQSILLICGAIVLFAAGHKIAQMLSQILLIRGGAKVASELRCKTADHLHRLPLSYHDRAKVGDLLYRAAYDSQAAQTFLCGAIVPIASGTVILLGILAMMLRMDVWLAAVAIAMLPLFWLAIKRFERSIEGRSANYHAKEAKLASTLQESLSSIRAVKAFTHERESDRILREKSRDSFLASQRLVRMQLVFTATIGILMATGTAAVVAVGAERVVSGRLLPGDILVFLAYLGMLYQPMNAFSQSAAVGQAARAQLRRVFEILDETTDDDLRPPGISPDGVLGKIEFDHVTFGYEPDRLVLRDFSLQVEPGQIVALVGKTGAGKTTIASLLLRFYHPLSGTIRLDGRDIGVLPVEWLRKNIGIVLQDSLLFAGTVRENIAYGTPGATDEKVAEAARKAQLESFIQELPSGYETIVGERGVTLSGGQRQRIAIARAFLKDAPILILDEPTSAVDANTEAALVQATEELMRGRTTFIIAHRLSTIRHADLIIVIEDGAVAEYGTHDDLIRSGGVYQSLAARHYLHDAGLSIVTETSSNGNEGIDDVASTFAR